MTRRAASVLLLLPGLAGLFCAACGEDESGVDPRLAVRTVRSDPRGAPVRVRHDVADGTTFRARVELSTRATQRRVGGSDEGTRTREGRAVIEVTWTFRRPPGALPRSEVTFAYVEAEGDNAADYRNRPLLEGRLAHDADGRPRPETLAFETGTAEQRDEARDLLAWPLLAGLAGSPPWVPARPVRAGEAWAFADVADLRARGELERQVREAGIRGDRPHIEGTVAVRAIRESAGERVLDLGIDVLLAFDGRFEGGALASGDRFEGEAVVSARTGVPRSFRVVHRGRKASRRGDEREELEFTSEAYGRVVRADDG